MAHKFVLIMSIVTVVMCIQPEIKDFLPETPCSQVGGNCIMKGECPHEINNHYLGLCPEQRSQGAECCHGVSTKEYRCRKFGGECFDKDQSCPPKLRATKATDCPADQFCCILV